MPRKQRFYYVYILSSLTGTLYTGITNSIYNRTLQHKGKENPGFTSKYDVNRLVYYEVFTNVRAAIRREKEIKGRTRKKKIALVESMNPKWKDLAEGWGEQLPPPSWQIREPDRDQHPRDSSGPETGPCRMTKGLKASPKTVSRDSLSQPQSELANLALPPKPSTPCHSEGPLLARRIPRML